MEYLNVMSLLRLALIAGCLPLSRGDDIPKFKVQTGHRSDGTRTTTCEVGEPGHDERVYFLAAIQNETLSLRVAAFCNWGKNLELFHEGSPSASGFLGGRLTEALTPAGGWTNAIEEWKIPKKLCKGLIKTIYQKECGGDHHRGRRRVCPSCGQRELCFVERICEIAYDIHTSLESDKMIERVTSV